MAFEVIHGYLVTAVYRAGWDNIAIHTHIQNVLTKVTTHLHGAEYALLEKPIISSIVKEIGIQL
jgi:hypothetical protein